ncbi:MAG: L-serine ammonia-lyase, iron-sulfur-dependent, subunit alpha [Bacillota bacterium]
MEKQPASIFNDVIGPVLTGPSSSHTAGPARIGNMLRMILGTKVTSAKIIMEATGSYPATYIGQGSDRGFIGGLMGIPTNSVQLINALEIAKENGMQYTFEIEELGETHPNAALIELVGINGATLSAMTHSTGGGMFEIVSIDGIPVRVCGDYDGFLIKVSILADKMEIESIIPNLKRLDCAVSLYQGPGSILYEIKTSEDQVDVVEQILLSIRNIIWIRKITAIMPIKSNNMSVPFSTAQEAMVYCKAKDISLTELGVVYEMHRGNITREQVICLMLPIIEIMRKSALDSVAGNTVKRNYLEPKASTIHRQMMEKELIPIGILSKVMLWAVAVMEYNNSLGVIVAAPTAGSAGVLPATIIAVGEELGKTEEEIALAMITAGAVGAFIANQATFSAELCGCQAENGSASCMAAAGIAALLGATVEQGFAAASLAMQNLLGLICDPIAGLTAIPCVNRNVIAAMNAIVSANLVMCSFNPVIPLDESIQAMWSVGKMLPTQLKCTGKGGLCLTPTGRWLNEHPDGSQ